MTTQRQAIAKRINALGYILVGYAVDTNGRKWKFKTIPKYSGPSNYFDTLKDVARYAAQVEQIREWQS